MSRRSLVSVLSVDLYSYLALTHATLYLFSILVRPMINEEQEEFINRILSILLANRSWKKLVTLDSLHAFCGRPISTDEARRLDA